MDDCFLCLSVNFEKFSCTSCRISTTRYGKKLFHKRFSSILYKNKKQIIEGVIYLKTLKIVCEEAIICNEVARRQPAILRKKLFHASAFMYFAFIFSEYITITPSEDFLKVCEHNFLQPKVALLVIYLFNHDLSKSTFFI